MNVYRLKLLKNNIELHKELFNMILEYHKRFMIDEEILALNKAIEASEQMVEIINFDIEEQRINDLL